MTTGVAQHQQLPPPCPPAPHPLPDTHHCCTSFSVTARENGRKEKKEWNLALSQQGRCVLHFPSATSLGDAPGLAPTLPCGTRRQVSAFEAQPGGRWGWGCKFCFIPEPGSPLRCQGSTASASLQDVKDHARVRLVHTWGGSSSALPSPQSQNIPGNICQNICLEAAWARHWHQHSEHGHGHSPRAGIPPGTELWGETSSNPSQHPRKLHQAPEKPPNPDKLENVKCCQPRVSPVWGQLLRW